MTTKSFVTSDSLSRRAAWASRRAKVVVWSRSVLSGVRYGEVDDLGPTLSEDAQSLATDVQGRNAIRIVHHLDVVPGDLAPPARFYCLQERLFRRESPRVTLRGRRFFGVAIFALGWGEDTFAETRRSRHRFGDTIDFNYVDAGGNDHGRC